MTKMYDEWSFWIILVTCFGDLEEMLGMKWKVLSGLVCYCSSLISLSRVFSLMVYVAPIVCANADGVAEPM